MTHRPLVLAAGLAVAALAVLAGEGRAVAQAKPDARADAAALFQDGVRLMSQGKYAEACPKLEVSERLDPGMGTLYRLSLCFEATGRTASAWVGYLDVAGQALTLGQAEREAAARGKAAALEPKLTRLKIMVQPVTADAGVEVKRDGAVVGPAIWGTAVPLDPGPHKVSATAPGKEPWEISVRLDQPGSTVSVVVPPLVPQKPVPEGPSRAEPPPVATGPIRREEGATPLSIEGKSPRPWQAPLGITLTVAGVAGVAVGTVLGVLAKSKFNQSNQGGDCNATTGVCNPTGRDLRIGAVSEGNDATYVFIPSAVVAATGIVLWATAPVRAAPQIGLGPAGVSLRGTW